MHPTHLPLRVTTGAYILNSGVTKLKADEGTAQYLHSAAASTYPSLVKDMKPQTFTKLLACGERAVGAALLAPMVSSTTAGAALTGFGSALMGMYFNTPSMTEEDGVRPTQEGMAVAKDAWLVGAGLTLLTQGIAGIAKSETKALKKTVRKASPLS